MTFLAGATFAGERGKKYTKKIFLSFWKKFFIFNEKKLQKKISN